ncbi:erythritol transport system permease protein [Lachnospiraceae bacterium PF1-21]|uniref:ABC transporter permease n=1 Tax=Ohessyouella blattaphilus TaxID=2949333 RepID=A0ABT1ELQ5_9FIRM|nr:ABC transporter permease [Ohessyouella blattaphilus]MCP1111409.1 ABC transporter permease [Ohessyouella blattaphilus]MCR8564803.1 ABC transporter permease [Ohessyouella blattaphilus]
MGKNRVKKAGNTNWVMTLLKGRTLLILAVLVIFFSFASPNFFAVNTGLTIAKHVALYGIMGIGMTYVIITGGIDLSVGAVAGLSGMVAGGLINEGLTIAPLGVTVYFGLPWIILISAAVGVLIGWLNGFIITRFNVAPFITTLGTMNIARGLANLRSNGATFSNIVGKEALGNTGFNYLGKSIFGIPAGVIILVLIAIVAACLLKYTPFGWHILAIGGNAKAAKLSGIKVEKNTTLVYMFSGFCSAIVGMISAAQLVAAHPATGEGWEMNAISAAVLGGTSMSGGIGSVGGTIIGAFIIGVINDGMTMCGVSEFWQKVIKGIVVIAAVIVDQFQRNLQAKMALQARNEGK